MQDLAAQWAELVVQCWNLGFENMIRANVILQVLPHIRLVKNDVDAVLLQQCRGTDARQL